MESKRNKDVIWSASLGARTWFGYAVAVGGTAIAAVARWALVQWVGEIPPYITFYPVVMAAALLGGTTAGVLATILTALAAALFFIPLTGQPWPIAPHYTAGLILFIAINIAISLGGGRLRAIHQRARLQTAALAAAANTIVITDREGVIRWVNPAFERLTGYTAAEALGKTPRVLKSDHQPPEFFKAMWETILAGRVWHGELVNKRKDGSLYCEEMTVTPVKDTRGEISHFVAIKFDISDRKQSEQALREARDALAQTNAELEQRVRERTAQLRETVGELEAFSYSLSHDLRAPLRSIRAFANLALEEESGKLSGSGAKYLKQVLNSARLMDDLITDVLALSRLSHTEICLAPMDVERLVREIIEARPELQPPKAHIRIDGPLVRVLGHEASLTQCLTNLMGNAVKFVARGTVPEVRIYTENRAERVRLWIEDNGIGIPSDAQEKIFMIFQRLHTRQEYEGTGIGLAIVKKAAERMGGSVGVESEPGKGSRFWVELRPA